MPAPAEPPSTWARGDVVLHGVLLLLLILATALFILTPADALEMKPIYQAF